MCVERVIVPSKYYREKKMWEDWNKLSDEDRRVIRERIEKSLAFCTAQLEEDGKTSISNYS